MVAMFALAVEKGSVRGEKIRRAGMTGLWCT